MADGSKICKACGGGNSLTLKQQYFFEAKDLYPDITLLHPVHSKPPLDLTRFENLNRGSQVMTMFECKYSSSFPSAGYKLFLQDAAKLEMLGDYCEKRFGRLPLLTQLIFDLDGGYAHKDFLARYSDEVVQARLANVHVLVINGEGNIRDLIER